MNSAEPVLPPSVNTSSEDTITITGITEPTILQYFETLNAGDFEVCAALFATDGVMYAPFESGLVGAEAIVAYLNQEAQGMKLQPSQGVIQPLEGDRLEVQVTGKVQTSLFGVNVSWFFVLDQSKIASVKIKLLASPQELINLRR